MKLSDRLLRVKPDGSVYVSIRLSLSLACHMRLAKFPMDMQVYSHFHCPKANCWNATFWYSGFMDEWLFDKFSTLMFSKLLK